jgi:hypothetical protein
MYPPLPPVIPIPALCACCGEFWLSCLCCAYSEHCERCVLHCGCPVCAPTAVFLGRQKRMKEKSHLKEAS